MFQLATNEPLFPSSSFGLTTKQINEGHERLLHKVVDDEDQLHQGFKAHLSERLPPDFGVENLQHFALFLRSMLQEDPQARISTTQLLSHWYLAGDMQTSTMRR